MRQHDAALDSQTERRDTQGAVGVEPSYASFSPIPHYHGDSARMLLIGAAALMLLASPFYADALRTQFPFLVIGALLTVMAAAFTDPHRRGSLIADAVVSGTGLAVFAGWALMSWDGLDPVSLMFRLVIAVVFLFAFYFSLKTVRAFALHEIGRHDQFGVLSEDKTGTRPNRSEGANF